MFDVAIEKILEIPARFIDVSIQHLEGSKIVLEDGKVTDLSSGAIWGAGVRVLDKTWGFASSNDVGKLHSAIERAHKIAKHGTTIDFEERDAVKDKVKTSPKINPFDVEMSEKKKLLHDAEKEVRGCSEVVSSSFVYSDSRIKSLYLNSEESRIESEYTRVAVYSNVFAKRGNVVQVGAERLGGIGMEAIENVAESARAASEKAVRLLGAQGAPAGTFRVVLDPKLAGVFIHEALGHAVEADHVLQGESILAGMLNRKIGSETLNILDDPTLKNSFGFYFYDSEGTKGRKKAVVENGILKSYLHSRETASRMGQDSTGNARAQGFSNEPIVRMSNTYIQHGDMKFEELVEDIAFGVYLRGSNGGEVDTIRGVFQFSAEEGFLIENGEVTKPVKDVALSGKTLEILKNVDGVGDDFDLHIGHCGKASQLVPVGDGGPHVRTFATVGGSGVATGAAP